MPPRPSADSLQDGHPAIAALSACLDELNALFQDGQWDLLPPLANRLDVLLKELQAGEAASGRALASATELQRLQTEVGFLLALATARQHQIAPLLAAWRSPPVRDATPTP